MKKREKREKRDGERERERGDHSDWKRRNKVIVTCK